MGRRSVQINIRATRDVAEALRIEAQARNLSLGDTLAALLTMARAGRDDGVTLDLPPGAAAALRAVAAAREVEPGVVLASLVERHLHRDLVALASELGTAPPPARSEEPDEGQPESDDSAEQEEDVGVFTVFD